MSAQEVADLTGLNKAQVYREIERGALRASRLGGVIRITADAYDEWLAGGDA